MDVDRVGNNVGIAAQAANLAKPAQQSPAQVEQERKEQEVTTQTFSEDDRVGTRLDVSA